jgi:hypothetical protein
MSTQSRARQTNQKENTMNKKHFATDAEYQAHVDSLEPAQDAVTVRGFFRVQIVDGDQIVGDSGYNANQVTNLGFNQYLVSAVGSIAGSKYVSHLALGTGGAPAASDTALAGEVGTRTAVTAATSSSSKTLRLTATFAAGWHTSASAHNISNIGMFNSSSGGTLMAGNTYASSSCASNQAVNSTYDLIFS